MKKCFVTLTLFILAWKVSYSQPITPNIRFYRYSVKDGLPEYAVTSIFQDYLGYMWFGTQDGLARFDGINFKVYSGNAEDTTSFPGKYIVCLHQDSEKNLWIGTDNGLFLYTRKKDSFKKYIPPADTTKYGIKIITSFNQKLIVDNYNNLYEFNAKTKNFTKIAESEAIKLRYFDEVKLPPYLLHKNLLWMGCENGLWCYNFSNREIKSFFNSSDKPKESTVITSISIDSQENIWCGTAGKGLITLNPANGKTEIIKHNPDDKSSLANDTCEVFIDSKNRIWVTTFKNMSLYNIHDKVFCHYPLLQKSYDASFICEDQVGNFWLTLSDRKLFNSGMYEKFPAYFNTESKETYLFKNDPENPRSFPSNLYIFTIITSNDGVVWIGTLPGMAKIDPISNRFAFSETKNIALSAFPSLGPFKQIGDTLFFWYYQYGSIEGKYALYNYINKESKEIPVANGHFEFRNSFYSFDYKNIYLYNTKSGNLQKTDLVDKRYLRILHNLRKYYADENNFLLFGDTALYEFRYNERLGKLLIDSIYKYSDKKGIYSTYPFKDHKNRIWCAARWDEYKQFLICFDLNTMSLEKFETPIEQIQDIVEYDNNLYFTTFSNGIQVYDPETKKIVSTFSRDKGNFPTNKIFGIIKDNKDNLWIGAEVGVYCFNPKKEKLHFFDNRELNIQSEINKGLWKSPEGEIFISLWEHPCKIFMPEKVIYDTIAPKVLINNFSLFNKRVLPEDTNSPLKNIIEETSEIELKYNQNVIGIEYVALHYIKSGKIEYAYWMVGIDSTWQNVGTTRKVNYAGLGSGEYIFKVKAMNVDGLWSNKPTILKITILPPWWQTWWFRIIEILALLLSIALFIQWRLKILKIEKQKLEQKVKERTTQLNETNEELKQTNEELKLTIDVVNNQKEEINSTLEHLKLTQAELIQSEKMASLGQLIAGIAHEINTPLGAINASISTITESTQQSIKLLPDLVKSLSDEELKLFMQFVNLSVSNNNLLSSKEERDCRRKLAAQLEEKGIAEAEDFADILVDMGIYDEIENYLPLVKPQTMQAAYHLSMQIKNSQNIKMAVDRASKVVFALKNYARYGNVESMVEANIVDGLETVLTLYQNQFKHGIALHKEFEEVPSILCYPDELNQVWTNLIHNAIQAMEGKGDLSISVSKNPKGFENLSGLAETHGHASLQIRITDTGKGIPTANKDRIFDAFFTTKPAGEGSGLGLHIVKQIIEKHNGKIWFESEIDRGTTFIVELPIENLNLN